MPPSYRNKKNPGKLLLAGVVYLFFSVLLSRNKSTKNSPTQRGSGSVKRKLSANCQILTTLCTFTLLFAFVKICKTAENLTTAKFPSADSPSCRGWLLPPWIGANLSYLSDTDSLLIARIYRHNRRQADDRACSGGADCMTQNQSCGVGAPRPVKNVERSGSFLHERDLLVNVRSRKVTLSLFRRKNNLILHMWTPLKSALFNFNTQI